jgi:D-ribose pyranose/furanose isomerase RbsD
MELIPIPVEAADSRLGSHEKLCMVVFTDNTNIVIRKGSGMPWSVSEHTK